MYGKLENNNLIYAPINYVTDNGEIIVNFNQSVELMALHGFKEVIDIKPIHDEIKQCLSVSGYTETENNITVNYTVNELPTISKTEFEILKETVDALVLSSLGGI